ncbi:hypothetical protein [Kingella negevensis]|nr:hypothetical protein [Kingella negevensis]MDK4680782.1 hypothetical protein [Kingella negevensis]MDK4681495.1 hypothetical protein [Kingella negevensis]MDK4687850.1 hypothetical protein [Kingella negevensis]MDK4691882.1 hypothetical protein [Kingella negevensis]MDK4692965.1 hypothetical protein [Kingella negevensis]
MDKKEFLKQLKAILKPIPEKGLRDKLQARRIEWFKEGDATPAQLLESAQIEARTYRFLPADYPQERELYEQALREEYGEFCGIRLDKYGYDTALIDRIQWQVFLRGVQLIRGESLDKTVQSEHQNNKG